MSELVIAIRKQVQAELLATQLIDWVVHQLQDDKDLRIEAHIISTLPVPKPDS